MLDNSFYETHLTDMSEAVSTLSTLARREIPVTGS
jgi:hypothetical protein